MRIFEAIQKTVVIYPGRFHPFHKGHASAYASLKEKYDTVYIATSNKIDPPKSPFSFSEKRAMMVHAGIPAGVIVQSAQPYRAEEILRNFDPSTTAVMFAVSEKDMAEDPRFSFRPKKDGSPSYFQPAPKEGAMQGFDTHGYITTVPTLDFTVLDQPMRSATELRRDFAKADDETQKRMIVDLYGSYDEGIHNIMRNKIKEHVDHYAAHIQAAESVFADLNMLYEHKQFDMTQVTQQASAVIDKINSIPVVESLEYLDPNDVMDSIVAVPGVGTMSMRRLMANVRDKMIELGDLAAKETPTAFRDIKYRMDSNIIGVMVDALANAFDEIENIRRKGGSKSKGIPKNMFDAVMHMHEAWSAKYKRSINCSNPKGFSQKAHCAGRKKTETKEAPPGTYFTKSGNLVKGKLTKDAKERGARQTDPKDKQRSKVPAVSQYNEQTLDEYAFQSIPLRVLDNLSSRKDNQPFPIRMGQNIEGGDIVYQVTPDTARKFMNIYLRKDIETQKAIDKTLQQPAKAIELMRNIAKGLKRSGAMAGDIGLESVHELKIQKPDAKDTLGVKRADMPQISKKNYPEYLDYLRDAGATFEKDTVDPDSLKSTQGEFSDAGVIRSIEKYAKGNRKPVIVSSDGYVIDGHHRWLMAKNTGQSVDVFRMSIPGKRLLQLTLDFPKTEFKDITHESAVGKIVKGVNTTPDVGPNQTDIEAKKLHLNAKPKLLHKTAAKNTSPNKAYNLGLAEIYTPLAIAIMEGGHTLPEVDEDMGAFLDSLRGTKPEPSTIKAVDSINKKLRTQRDARETELKNKLRALTMAVRNNPTDELVKRVNAIRRQLQLEPLVAEARGPCWHGYQQKGMKKKGNKMVPNCVREAVTQSDIDQLEKFADKMFAKVGIDVEFTRHFMDRVNDARNKKDITPAELTRLFKQTYKRYGKPIATMGPDAEAVMKDLQTDINLPFALRYDKQNNELDLIAKTVMRKKDFKTSNKEFAVERGSINVPMSGGMIAQIVPHRPLKVKKSTPGRLSYDQPKINRKRNNRG